MGTWSIWHLAIFIIIAIIGSRAAGAVSQKPANPIAAGSKGYGGWLFVFSVFVLFWAAQELGEFYRVKTQIEILIPTALTDPGYQEYIRYALSMAWFEAVLLLACCLILIVCRAGWAPKAVIAALWIAGPLSAAAEFLMAESYFGEYLLEHDYSALAATILFATTWTCYLLKSRRVKNTYGA